MIFLLLLTYDLDATIVLVHKLITRTLHYFWGLLSIQFLLPWLPSRIDQVPLSDYLGCYMLWIKATTWFFLTMAIGDKNIFHHKSYKQEVLIWRWLFWRSTVFKFVKQFAIWFLPYFFSMSGYIWKPFRICLMIQLWFACCDIILQKSSDALDRKWSSFSVQLAIKRNYENIEP